MVFTVPALEPAPESRSPVASGFRADVEGLRGVAILLVIAAHAGVGALEGGFIGVDVFFVLSGFLITRLLLDEVATTGTIRLLPFYLRRLRRLLPALACMVVAVMLAATVVLVPFEQHRQAAAGQAALIWASNLFFSFSETDYFEPGADTNLFLHTWSLGVEEQFYLAWPFLLLLVAGALRRRDGAIDPGRLYLGLGLVIAASFSASLLLTYVAPLIAFYMAPTRAWQFALGALVALPAFRDARRGSATRPRIEGLLHRLSLPDGAKRTCGLALILAAAIRFDEEMPYPGAWAAIPSIGTALLLHAGPASDAISRFLSTAPMQHLGRISYSWYLWHWPVLVLGDVIVPADEPVHRALLVFLSLVLAEACHYTVESPIRRSPALATRPRLAGAALCGLTVASLAFVGGRQERALDEQTSLAPDRYATVRWDLPVIYAEGCDSWTDSAEVEACAFGDQDADEVVVMIGDSLAGQWFPAVASVSEHRRLVVLTKSSCPMVDEHLFYGRIGKEYSVCSRWREDALAAVAAMRPDVVIMASNAYDFTETQWIEGTRRILSRLAPVSETVLVVRATPTLPFDGVTCLARRDRWPSFLAERADCSAEADSPRSSEIYAWLERASEPFANVEVLDLNPLVCPAGRCRAEHDGIVVFRDAVHITASYAESLAPALAAELEKHTGLEWRSPDRDRPAEGASVRRARAGGGQPSHGSTRPAE